MTSAEVSPATTAAESALHPYRDPTEPFDDVLFGGYGSDSVASCTGDDLLVSSGAPPPDAAPIDGPFEDILVSGPGSDVVVSCCDDPDDLAPSDDPFLPDLAYTPGR